MAGQRGRRGSEGSLNIQWIEKYCLVPEGRDVGKPVKLRPWQKQIIRGIYDTPTRRAIISFGRKNGKTALSAFLVLLHLAGRMAKRNSQLYSTAQSRDQAAILFALAAKVVRQSPDLSSYITIRDTRKELLCPEMGTIYHALSAEASTAYGLSPAFTVHDELGQVRGPVSELYEALETASGAQESPLSIIISTQAPNPTDLLSTLIRTAQEDPDGKTKLFLWTAPEDLDPFDVKTIKLANPAYGDFLNSGEVMDQVEQARVLPAREGPYRNLILNQQVESINPMIPRTLWDAARAEYKLEDFHGERCWIGLDLSATTDTTAMVLVFRRADKWWCWPYFWLPGEGLAAKAHEDRVPYDVWKREGHLLTTPGRAIDQLYVAKKAAEIASRFKVQTVAYDRMFMKFLTPQLEREGVNLPLQEFGQGFVSMAPAVNTVESVLLNDEFRHPGHPILTNHSANAICVSDDAGNRKISKRKSTGRIDGIVSLAMALSVAVQDLKPATPTYQMLFV